MKGLGKHSPKKISQDEKHIRTRYMDHSRRFLDWVDSLGFEQTRLGRLAHRLDERFGVRRVALLFLFCLVLSLFLVYDFDFTYNLDVGDVATTDIQSPLSFQIVDEVATELKRQEAERGAPPVFDYYQDVYEGVYNRVYKAFKRMRDLVRATPWPEKETAREEKVKEFHASKIAFEEELGVEVPMRIFEWLVLNQFNVQIENTLIRTLVQWSADKIADSPATVLKPEDEKVIARTVDASGGGEEIAVPRDNVKDMRKWSTFTFAGVRGATNLDQRSRDNLIKLAHSLIVPNMTFNRKETADRRHKARTSVPPVQISVQKGQTIVSAGQVIQPLHTTLANEIRNLKSDRRKDVIALIAAILLVVLILVFFSYLRRFTLNKVKIETKDILVMGVVNLIVVAITKLFLFMTDASFNTRFGDTLPSTMFLFAAPIAAGPMMVGLLITSGEVVWLFTLFMAVSLSFMVDPSMSLPFLLVTVVGGIAAARGVFGCKKRNDIYVAGLRTGLINAAVIGLILLLNRIGEDQFLKDIAWHMPAGFIGGVMSSLVALMLIPLLETLFNYTTDVKLLELSNLNHPLMRDMMVRAPGTYHHSLAVGSMVEAAANEIDANPLLAKVMAYYHDIGKMEHAQYFIENQRPGFNPHDQISPYMSKTILIAHVKDGAELGMDFKLGKPIIEGILQHHGTTLISYFYNKALEEQDEDIDQVDETDFRYPGPKPQFKEAALVMLADSIEAAARSLEEPTAARLTSIVKNIIQSKFIDGQLDECNLTLKDLSVIEKAFQRILLSIYHQRIDYPHLKYGVVSPVAKSLVKKGAGRKGTFPA